MIQGEICSQTESLLITESHLLLPMIWEGDLNIHSNVKMMANSHFRNIILHGDTSLSVAISLIENTLNTHLIISKIKTKYLSPLFIGDEVYVNFSFNNAIISFSLQRQGGVEIINGHIYIAEVNQ